MPVIPLASAAILSLVFVLVPAFATADSAQPAPSPSTAESMAGCPNPASIAPLDSYRYAIDDTRTLAFIASVEALPLAGHAAVVTRAKEPLPNDVAEKIDAAVADACATSRVSFRLVRFVYDIAGRWSSDDALDLQGAARYAIAALYLGERFDPVERNAALARFGISTGDLDAFAARASTVPHAATSVPVDCESTPISATSTAPTRPTYPQAAIDARAEGTVEVTVGLDPHGFVRFVMPFERGVPQNAGGDALVDASLEAAGSSTFTPAFVKCHAVAGTYLFRADYRGRK